MGYDGYTELLCKKGHYRTQDAQASMSYNKYGPYTEYGKCDCGEPYVWGHAVNQTNPCEHDEDSHYDYCCGIPAEEYQIKSAQVDETCPQCGHTKIIEETTFFPPPGKGFVIK